jgi:hypothetical protein
MSIRKTSEYRDAMKAHKACYSEDMAGPKLSTRMVTIAKYHTSLEKLVSRMLKDESVSIHYINSDRDSFTGQTYYDIDFGCARSFVAGMAANCGVKIPSFSFKGNFEFSVDMTPDDVLCEVRSCLQERDDEVDLAKNVIVIHAKAMKEEKVS